MNTVILNTRSIYAALLALGAAYAVFFASGYEVRVLTLAGVYVILVLGYQFVFGHAGALSLAHGAFFGLGGYVTGVLGSQYGWTFLATFPLSLLAPALLSALVALPVLRLQSHYFALATLAIAQTVLLIAVNWVDVTGGANGLYGVPGINALGVRVPYGLPLFAFVWTIVAVAAWIASQALRGRRSNDYTMMRDAPLTAAASGLDIGRLRTSAFVLSASFAGAAGALYAHTLRVVSPEILGFNVMVLCLTMTVIGGRTRIAGAVIGAVLLTHLPEWFRGLEEYYLIATGAILLAAILFAPNGLSALLPVAKPHTREKARQADTGARAGFVKNTNLTISGLVRQYGGVRAIDGIDFQIASREIVGIIGPNGSGKTTLANLITGFARPDAGEIRWNGAAIAGDAPHRIARAGIARSFQSPDLPSAMTVHDTVAAGFPPFLATPKTETLLAEFGLNGVADIPSGSLPHAARRRTDIARALAANPGLLILDEPAAGLTKEETRALASILRQRADAGLAILLIEHNTGFLISLADRLICLSAGAIVAEGRPEDVLRDSTVIEAYLGTPLATGS